MIEIVPVCLAEIEDLCRQYHAYGGASKSATYALGVREEGRLVAAYAWQPPPVGAAKSVNPVAPSGVLALSRMVAVPRAERQLRHVSGPLRAMMKRILDRTRWPSLVTYSDEGLGHTGHVYRCSGWHPTTRAKRPQYTRNGVRTSTYRDGVHDREGLVLVGHAWIQRWEHHVVPVAESAAYMADHGWRHVPVPGRTWASGNPAYTWVQEIALPPARLPADPPPIQEAGSREP